MTIWVVIRGGGSRQMVTKCEKGEGVSKIGGRPVPYFLNGPNEEHKKFMLLVQDSLKKFQQI